MARSREVSRVGRWRDIGWPYEPETLRPPGDDVDDWFGMYHLLADLCGHPEGQLVRVTVQLVEPEEG